MNVAHLYFITLPTILNKADLRRVTMSSSAWIGFQTTSDCPHEAGLASAVYEGRVDTRGSSLRFMVPLETVAPAHLLHHPLKRAERAYYEVVGQEIVRVAVEPGVARAVAGGAIAVPTGALKQFGHVIEGDASRLRGLAELRREAGPVGGAHIERFDAGLDLFGCGRPTRTAICTRSAWLRPAFSEPPDGGVGLAFARARRCRNVVTPSRRSRPPVIEPSLARAVRGPFSILF